MLVRFWNEDIWTLELEEGFWTAANPTSVDRCAHTRKTDMLTSGEMHPPVEMYPGLDSDPFLLVLVPSSQTDLRAF